MNESDWDFEKITSNPEYKCRIKNIRTGAVVTRTSRAYSGEDAANKIINGMKEPSDYAILSYTRIES
jgi:hypothetical protein